VYRSPDPFKAFQASKDILEMCINGKLEFENHALEGAVSSIVVIIADEQPTMASAAQMSFINSVVKGVDADYNSELLRMVREVTVDQIKDAMKDILLPAFTPGLANVVVTCATIMEEVTKKGFSESGFKTSVRPLSDFTEDYGLEVELDEDEENEEDEGEDDDEDDEDDEDEDEA